MEGVTLMTHPEAQSIIAMSNQCRSRTFLNFYQVHWCKGNGLRLFSVFTRFIFWQGYRKPDVLSSVPNTYLTLMIIVCHLIRCIRTDLVKIASLNNPNINQCGPFELSS
jgi:hypothetical protein